MKRLQYRFGKSPKKDPFRAFRAAAVSMAPEILMRMEIETQGVHTFHEYVGHVSRKGTTKEISVVLAMDRLQLDAQLYREESSPEIKLSEELVKKLEERRHKKSVSYLAKLVVGCMSYFLAFAAPSFAMEYGLLGKVSDSEKSLILEVGFLLCVSFSVIAGYCFETAIPSKKKKGDSA